MLLAIDLGNTNTVLGGFEGEELIFTAEISTDLTATADEYAGKMFNALAVCRKAPDGVDGVILSSVVPQLNRTLTRAAEKLFGLSPMIVGPGVKTGLNIRCDAPSSVGSDLICACVAARDLYGAPGVILDLGTTTNLSVLNDTGAFIGVSICPGVLMGLNALGDQTAQLTKVSLDAPASTVAKNTADALRSGIIFGHASMIDGMLERIFDEMGGPLPVIATGTMASVILPHCRHGIVFDGELVLKGLRMLYEKNR